MMLLSSMLGRTGNRADALRMLGLGLVFYAVLVVLGNVFSLLLRVPTDSTFISRSIFVSTLFSALTLPLTGMFLFR